MNLYPTQQVDGILESLCQSVCQNLVAIILASNRRINFKFGVWYNISEAYIVSDIGSFHLPVQGEGVCQA